MQILKIFIQHSPFFDIVILFQKPVIDCGYYNGISIYIIKDINNVPEIFINCGCDHNPAIYILISSTCYIVYTKIFCNKLYIVN